MFELAGAPIQGHAPRQQDQDEDEIALDKAIQLSLADLTQRERNGRRVSHGGTDLDQLDYALQASRLETTA